MKTAIAQQQWKSDWKSDLERVCSGSLHVDAFYQRHRAAIGCVARSIYWVAGFERDEAEQVVRLAIWHAIGTFDSTRGHIVGWVRFIVNKRLQMYARAARRSLTPMATDDFLEEQADLGTGPEELVGALTNYKNRVLGRMDRDSQAVLNAHFIEGFTAQQIYDVGVLPGIGYSWTVKRVHAVMRVATVLATEF